MLEEKIFQENFDKTLQFLIDSGSVKSDSISNWVCFSITTNKTCRDAFNINEEIQSFKNKLVEEFNRLTQALFAEKKSLQSDALIPDEPTTRETNIEQKSDQEQIPSATLMPTLKKSLNNSDVINIDNNETFLPIQNATTLKENKASRKDNQTASAPENELPKNTLQVKTATPEIILQTRSLLITQN